MGCLRLWLAFCVVLFHIASRGAWTLDGRLSVESFYLVSGFFMALILDTRYRGMTRVFYLNRFLRIYPLYWFVLFLTVALAWGLYKNGFVVGTLLLWIKFVPTFKSISVILLVFSQLLLVTIPWLFLGEFRYPDGAFHFSTTPFARPLPAYPFIFVGPAWSLGVEELFYLAAPFVTLFSDKALLCILALTAAIKGYFEFFHGLSYDPWAFMFPPFEVVFFVGGIVSYRLYRRLKLEGRLDSWIWKAFSGLLVVAVLGLPFMGITDTEAWLPLGALLLLGIPWMFEWGSHRSWDRSLGNLSYPLYIVHAPMIWLIGCPIFGKWHGALNSAVVPICFVSAWLLYLVVEKPVNRFRERIRSSASVVK